MKTFVTLADLGGYVMETTTLPRLVGGETIEFQSDVYRREGNAVETVAHLSGPFRVALATLSLGGAGGGLQTIQRVTLRFAGSDDVRPVWRVLDHV